MSQRENLVQLGLSQREADCYLALLSLEEANVGRISKITKESRSHLYETIRSLTRKGLVSSVTKNNMAYFRAAPPHKLLDFVEEKMNIAKETLPSLQQLQAPSGKPFVSVYEGTEGMKTILNDIVRTGKEWLSIGSVGGAPLVLHEFSIEKFHQDRIKRGVTLKVLLQDSPRGRKRGKAFQRYPLIKLKYLPKTYQNPSTIYTYGNKTALIMWLTQDKPFAVLIESVEIAKSFHAFFYLLWDQN